MDDLDVCRHYVADQDKLSSSYKSSDAVESNYIRTLRQQVERRNLSTYRCQTLIDEANNKIAAGIMLGILAIGAGAAAANSSGYGNSYSNSYSGSYGYAWDQFYDGYGNLTWRCRDKSNGQFANDYSCSSAWKNDSTWPGK